MFFLFNRKPVNIVHEAIYLWGNKINIGKTFPGQKHVFKKVDSNTIRARKQKREVQCRDHLTLVYVGLHQGEQ